MFQLSFLIILPMEDVVELRCNKKKKKTHDQIDHLPAYAFLPRDLICYLLMLVIDGAKSAVVTWRVCKLWRVFTGVILPKVVTSWDFVNYDTLDPRGRAIWPGSFLNPLKDLNLKRVEIEQYYRMLKKSTVSTVDITLPNILEVYANLIEYRFTFRFNCPCTLWKKNATIYLVHRLDVGEMNINEIRQHKDGSLSMKRQFIDECYHTYGGIKSIQALKTNDVYLKKLDVDEGLCDSYDCKISMGSFKKITSAFDGIFGRMFHIKIIDGVFIMKQIGGYTEYPYLFLWSNDELKRRDAELLWGSDIRKCTPDIFSMDIWIHHMRCVGDFEFVYFRKFHSGAGYKLQTLAKNSKMSLFTEIMSIC